MDATRPIALPAALLGFALSGFFDGILLHQILQWHHLLSALDGDLRFQVAADGWFHVGMYAIGVAGLWLLWQRRATLPGAPWRAVAGWGLVGFGLWHVVDAVGSHWLLGLHRIRMDVPNPLAWDLGWLALFGLVPLAVGALLLRRPRGGRGAATAVLLAAATLGAGAWALRPPAGVPFATVAFAPHAAPLAALEGTGARVVWSDGDGVLVLDGLTRREALRLYARGALYVGGAGLPVGCLAWSDAARDA